MTLLKKLLSFIKANLFPIFISLMLIYIASIINELDDRIDRDLYFINKEIENVKGDIENIDSKVFDIASKTDNYTYELNDLKGSIESNENKLTEIVEKVDMLNLKLMRY
ncbi:conserved hypothetical protein [Denitrovibrio acetiphilus DSM 12809]|uniref:Uncharacterized protein n=1 Tax=Denitrovibrio acetiphilus (strain DSM 12809 / NBRC 114555 / N2460) TaxID=522772 RepID=D4H436_DENA2|nr:hypothetical protein [Denitrovibrio acetiphilus]ADD67347.1 conserved hypothetical protein [Denitrovibrio acetiphilus DSM 12809]